MDEENQGGEAQAVQTPPAENTPAQAGRESVQIDPAVLEQVIANATAQIIAARANETPAQETPAPQEARTNGGEVIETVPQEGRSNEARVGNQRDTDGPNGVYIQTARLFRAVGNKNDYQKNQILDHMVRAGFYNDSLATPEENSRTFKHEGRAIPLTSSEGAPFLPVLVENRIEELREEFGAMRRVCTVFNIDSGTVKVPNVSGRPKVFAVNEGSALKMRKATWGNVTLDPLKWGLIRAYSSEMRDEVGAQWVRKVTEQNGRAFAEAEDETVLVADGTATFHSLTGLLNAGGVTQYTMDSGNTSFEDWSYGQGISAMKLTNAGNRSMGTHIIHPDHRLTMATFTDPANQYIYPPNTVPSQLVRPVLTTEAMPDLGDDAVSTNFHVFGDFSFVNMAIQRGVTVALLDQATILDTDDSTEIHLGLVDGLALRFTARWDVKIGVFGSFVKSRTAAS